MNLETLKLLTYTPEDALLIIANESLGTSFSPDNSTIKLVREISGILTEATVEGKVVDAANSANSYEGQTTFMFNRVDLTGLFGDIFSVKGELPTTLKNILNTITDKTKILFDDNDFEDVVILANPIQLTPKPDSRRWTGQLNIALTT